jgi:hypothetical protein
MMALLMKKMNSVCGVLCTSLLCALVEKTLSTTLIFTTDEKITVAAVIIQRFIFVVTMKCFISEINKRFE